MSRGRGSSKWKTDAEGLEQMKEVGSMQTVANAAWHGLRVTNFFDVVVLLSLAPYGFRKLVRIAVVNGFRIAALGS